MRGLLTAAASAAAVLLLGVSPLMAREIRQERFSLLSETVRLTDRETFVLTGTISHRQSACGEKVTEATDVCELPLVHFQLGAADSLGVINQT